MEKKKYGIKAYGSVDWFDSAEDMRKYLVKWMANTEGSERDRAVAAFVNLENGITYTDTDVI
jgi:hypothetical protein